MPETPYLKMVVSNAGAAVGGSSPMGPPLQPPGGGGTYDGMLEARVASLEADVKNIRENVGEMKADLKSANTNIIDLKLSFVELKTNVSYLPSKTFLVTTVTSGAAFAIVVLTLLSKFGWLVAGAPK
ncbi:hypothetical protein LPB73_12785 [Tardiphaga sp. 37S4]|uniref:hypothetical protein n=1 Tax=Tardiphaga sp. 37S4 TaxID=1404741 RepID=UPI001E53A20C|nr:hypothetical protein [Tardiphaga sp. 37S4]UFS78192.1 hypothetical protein LPB73_12785 [Tardiphaga sp. 37S4]